jgi:arylsulfatase A-like enzyme
VHYFDPHQPYTPPPGFAEKYAAFPYDGEIAFVDSQIGRLLDTLNELKVSDHTLVVLIADHGQGFMQHLELTHGLFVYDATLHVPFIMKYGKRWGGLHIRRPVSSVDIMPTILSLLGIKGLERCDGEDLTRPPAASPRLLFAETLEGLDEYAVAPLQTVREGPMKYIHAPTPELYI